MAALLLLAPHEGRAQEDHWIGHAVLVGVSETGYNGNDAVRMREELLRDTEHWCESNIALLVESDATYDNVDDALAEMAARAYQDDVCLFLFSGHGGPTLYDYLGYGGVPYWMSICASRHKCVIVESCSSGKMIDSLFGMQDIVCMTSSDADQRSYSAGVLQQGVFAFYVVDALGLAATDTDADGMVSAQEVFEYAGPAAAEWDHGQEPQMYDSHGGPLHLVTTGSGSRDEPVTPLDLPLGGGILWGVPSCAAGGVGGGTCVLALLGAVSLAALLLRRRPGLREVFLAAPVAALLAAGCSGRGAPPAVASTAPRLVAALRAPGEAGRTPPIVLRAGTLASARKEPADARPVPEAASASRMRSRSRSPLKGCSAWFRGGLIVPMAPEERAYLGGPTAGVYARVGNRIVSLELGLDASLVRSKDAEIGAGLGCLHVDLTLGPCLRRAGLRPYLHAGRRVFANAVSTYWPSNPVYEYDTGRGFGAGVMQADGRWDIRVSYDVPGNSRNITGFLNLTGATRF